MSLTTAHSLWLAPLCLLLGLALAWVLYRRTGGKDGFSRNVSVLLAVLRAMVVALIAFFLLEPMVRILVREVRKPIVVIAHDGSSSLLAVGDTAAIRSTYPEEINDLVATLDDRFEVRSFTYGEGVTDGLSFTQTEGLTDIDQALREVYDRFSGPDLGAVIIDGDGIYTRGRDPRSSADRLGVPVFAIALGDTTVRSDLVLRGVEHNRIGYLGNELPLLVRVEAKHMGGTRTRVSVLHAGKEVVGKDIVIAGHPSFVEIPFTVKAERAGMQRFTAVVRPVEGEASVVNNRADILIEVLDDRQKVLLLAAAPHPDLGALRAALGGLEGYGTELAYAADFTGKLSAFDLVILHGLPTAKRPIQPILQEASTAGVPLCFILGSGVDLNAFNAQSAGVRVTTARGSITDAQAVINKDFTFFTLDVDQQRAIERFPPLQVPFGQFELGRSATALCFQRIGVVNTNYPLIAFTQQQERRVGVVAGEGLWRWRLADLAQNGDHSRFDRLVHKLVQFLALKASKERFRVTHAPHFAENEPVLFSAELYNASFEPVNEAEVSIVLKDEEGRDFPYVFSPSGTGYRLDAGRLPEGTYTWTAHTAMDGKRYNAAGEIHIQALMAEQRTTVADHGLWADLAARTQGETVRPGGTAAIVKAMEARKDLIARSYAHPSFSDLIGLRWLFFLILGLLTVEWVVRRRNGSY
ncbi:MAG: hypothetical protein IPH05_03755 [Flavobacteriales bacterium]|jgi:hypothetical protein|nr:hypothetical protein [Flavobacteriales bacterium]MBK6882053.1 hypothetical protein [Flavobacteriales bacterium]MBK7103509.1 hypothetical protein [Flavobacteriales bacterium]MBK7112431.1 hypothetical protein [Flavobacteriales bacterium]MBK7620323.1 hypothetical protein [Flavobacteriales bacterium]